MRLLRLAMVVCFASALCVTAFHGRGLRSRQTRFTKRIGPLILTESGTVVKDTVQVRNPTDKVLTLSLAEKSCDCIDVSFDRSIPPYGVTPVRLSTHVSYGIPEKLSVVRFETNSKEIPEITAELLTVSYPKLDLSELDRSTALGPDSPARASFTLRSYAFPGATQDPLVAAPLTPGSSVTLTYVKSEPREGLVESTFQMCVQVNPPADGPLGERPAEERTTVRIRFSQGASSFDKELKMLRAPHISARPSSVFLSLVNGGSRRAKCILAGDLPFRVLSFHSDEPALTCQVDGDRSKAHVVTIYASGGFRPNDEYLCRGIRFQTDHENQRQTAVKILIRGR